MKTLNTWAAAAAFLALTSAAQAALVNRGGGMIYDTTRNITWLSDMNHAFTSGYAAQNAGGFGMNQIEANGRMGWNAATAWANNLVHGGFSGWRLPTLTPNDPTCTPGGGLAFNCTGGELSGLFVTDLGNQGNSSVLDGTGDTAEQIANLAMFSNVNAAVYWSGTELVVPDNDVAWIFNTIAGFQGISGKSTTSYALAVRTGDVAAAVPEPHTLSLALLALGATLLARKR